MIQEKLHHQLVLNSTAVKAWFQDRASGLGFPFYSSFDIRDSGHKIAPVDANIYPAGFNNICPTDQDSAVDLMSEYIRAYYPHLKSKILLITEEHTQNPYYWDNVKTLKNLLSKAGFEIRIAFPKVLSEALKVQSASGEILTVQSGDRNGTSVSIDGWEPELIISNNDFANAYEDWMDGLVLPVNPPQELGWHRRRKDQFFKIYNRLATELAEIIKVEPWHLTVETESFENFNIEDQASREALASRVENFLNRIQSFHNAHSVSGRPFAFVKNSAGTYGLAVIQVLSGDEIRKWGYKSRKKMKAAKGGRDVDELVIQEGIPTVLSRPGETAEPVIYMVGCQLAGGFLRAHSEKGPEESLNSPGAVYKRLCVSDLQINPSEHEDENVYGWIGKLGALSIGLEAKAIGVEIGSKDRKPCSLL